MGRKSKLTELQWDEVARRALNGEKVRPLAREFGITESAIRQRISSPNKRIKHLAEQKVAIETEIRQLPIKTQAQISILADELMSISINLASAGKFGSMVAKHSMGLAAKSMAKVNKDDPMDSADLLQGVAALTRISNDASVIGNNMLRLKTESGQKADDVIVVERNYGHKP